MINKQRILTGILTCGITSLTGCGVAPQEFDDVAQTTQEITSSGEVTDSTGKVHISVTQCDWVPASEHPFATCAVDSSKYVLVGGGAETEQTGAGALLTGSYPCNQDHLTWCAESKDHKYVSSHRLRAYAVGMRIDGYTASSLSQSMVVSSVSSARSSRPGALALPYYHPYFRELYIGWWWSPYVWLDLWHTVDQFNSDLE